MECRALKVLLLDLLNWCTLGSLLNRCAAMVFVSLIYCLYAKGSMHVVLSYFTLLHAHSRTFHMELIT